MTKRTEPERRLVTVDEFCHQASIGRTLFYKLVREGKIQIVKLGSATRVSALAHTFAHTSTADWGELERTDANTER